MGSNPGSREEIVTSVIGMAKKISVVLRKLVRNTESKGKNVKETKLSGGRTTRGVVGGLETVGKDGPMSSKTSENGVARSREKTRGSGTQPGIPQRGSGQISDRIRGRFTLPASLPKGLSMRKVERKSSEGGEQSKLSFQAKSTSGKEILQRGTEPSGERAKKQPQGSGSEISL